MEGIIILMAVAAIAVVGYIFFASSREAKEKKRQENDVSELKQQVITSNVKLQKLEFEYNSLQKDAEDARRAFEDMKNELETLRKKEFALSEEAARLKEKERKQEVTIDTLKAENATVKGKILDKENEMKKLLQEIKTLQEKIDQLETPDGSVFPGPTKAKKEEPPLPSQEKPL